MPIKTKFIYSWPPGVTPIIFTDWIKTLPSEQQLEFLQSRDRQHAFRSEAIADGRMIIDDEGTYVWKDKESRVKNKPYDDTWLRYWERYIKETNTIFEVVDEEIDSDNLN